MTEVSVETCISKTLCYFLKYCCKNLVDISYWALELVGPVRLARAKLSCSSSTQQKFRMGHFLVPFCLRFKTSLSAKHSYENEFRLQVHFHANQTHFHKKGFALRLVLKQRHTGTGKWPINTSVNATSFPSSLIIPAGEGFTTQYM